MSRFKSNNDGMAKCCADSNTSIKERLKENIASNKIRLKTLKKDMKALARLNNAGYRYPQNNVNEMIGICFIEICSCKDELKKDKQNLKLEKRK